MKNETSFFHRFDGELLKADMPLHGKKELTVMYEDNQVYEVWVDGEEFDYDMPYYRGNPYELAETHIAEGEEL